MAVCDPCRCKFFTAVPCFTEGSGACGILFCFCSKPRCRFCHTLYEQKLVCPWHWLKSGQKALYIGDSEQCCVSGAMAVVAKFLAAPLVLFIYIGSAHFRRDVNQGVKGMVNFAFFSVGLGSIMFLGPFALVIMAFLLITDPIVDWFFMGRCDDCWEYKCTGLLCCFGGSRQEGEPSDMSRSGTSTSTVGKPKTTKSLQKFKSTYEGVPGSQEMMEMETADYQEELDKRKQAEGGSNVCFCCCAFCLLILVGLYFGLREPLAALADKASEIGNNLADHANGSFGLLRDGNETQIVQ